MELSQKALTVLQKCNENANTINGWQCNYIQDYYNELAKRGSVTIGFRTVCGNKTDKTHKVFKEWHKFMKTLKKEVAISEQVIPQQLKNTTSAGGFWNEIKYTINQ